MIICLCLRLCLRLCPRAFLVGFTAGDYFGECRWKRLALDALEVTETAIDKLRGSRRARQSS